MGKPRTPSIFTSPQDAALAFYQAFEAKDIDAMMATWADDEEIVCVHPGGPRLVGYDAVRASWERIFAAEGRIAFRLSEAVVIEQLAGSLAGLSDEQMVGVVLAYEPVWAIGTGRTATPEQAQEIHAAVRARLARMFSQATADRVVVQYGGSVKPENAGDLLARPDIDGALVGGASLKAADFLGIVAAARAVGGGKS